MLLVASRSGPNTKAPSGTVPPKAMNHRAMTRPRTSSASVCWSTVIIAVTVPK